MIGIKTALALYAGLAAISLVALKGSARYLALIIVLGLAAKTVVAYYRSRLG